MSKLSENFTIAEYTKSQTATRHGIDNSLSEEHLENAKIGGSSKSQHCKGQAVDLECLKESNADVAMWIENNLDFDQLILEFYTIGDPRSGWAVSYTHLTLPTR